MERCAFGSIIDLGEKIRAQTQQQTKPSTSASTSGSASASTSASTSVLEPSGTKKSWVFTESQISYICRATVAALDYLHHEQKIIHRDIKGRNILLAANGGSL